MKQLSIICIAFILFPTKNILSQQFGFRVDKGIIKSSEVVEASGIAASSKNPGMFWTHNDSGDKSRIFAFDSLGNNLGTFLLAGIQNRDWEDIAIGPGPVEGAQYIYIGNIGDNSARYHTKYIYRINEPDVVLGQTAIDTVLYEVERLAFQYPDGKRNAETLMIDPLSLDIFIVSKEENTKVYRLTWPYTFYNSPPVTVDTLEQVAELPFSTAVGGDISSDGKEILIKRKNIIYYWVKEDIETIVDVLQKLPSTVPYFKEPQGEAICWASDLSGYYTISEGAHPHLYFYPRLVTSVEHGNNLPDKIKLYQNYPNPFNPTTLIKYSIPKLEMLHVNSQQKEIVKLKIYDILGREVAALVNEKQKPGTYEVQFNAENIASGLYLYKLSSGEYNLTRKMLLIR